MKASYLLRQNIKTILKARGQAAHDLAVWCRMDDSWISKILSDGPDDRARGIPLKHLDRIADFFGLSVYQLFQPGISPLTERRNGLDRRSGQDRRISGRRADLPTVRQLSVTPEDEALIERVHALTYEQYQHVLGWIDVARFGRSSGRDIGNYVVHKPASFVTRK